MERSLADTVGGICGSPLINCTYRDINGMEVFLNLPYTKIDYNVIQEYTTVLDLGNNKVNHPKKVGNG